MGFLVARSVFHPFLEDDIMFRFSSVQEDNKTVEQISFDIGSISADTIRILRLEADICGTLAKILSRSDA